MSAYLDSDSDPPKPKIKSNLSFLAVKPVDVAAFVELGERAGLDELRRLVLGEFLVALGQVVDHRLDRAPRLRLKTRN